MRLPENSIGISDIEAWRECPARMAFGMKRHTEGEHPEAHNPATAYGSAMHEAFEAAADLATDDESAIQRAFNAYAKWLDPDDLEQMRHDMTTYREREYTGVELVGAELELRVPLFEWRGERIFFRCRLDRVYRRLDRPGTFIHVDYKSSKWAKTEPEVHQDVQLWSYNFAIHEFFPECEDLVQVHDQLRHGRVPTSKNAAQRDLIRDWLIKQVTAILEDEELAPTFNEWCAWCPLIADCPEPRRVSRFQRARIEAILGDDLKGDLDGGSLGPYLEQLEDVRLTLRAAEKFKDVVEKAVKTVPASERGRLGYELKPGRNVSYWPAHVLPAVRAVLGDDFDKVVTISKTAVERVAGERAEDVIRLAEKKPQAPTLKKMKT